MKIVLGNIYCKLVIGGRDHLVDPKLLKTLRSYMSVNVPGAYFSDAYRDNNWDGKRYFITPNGRMATGFLPTLLKFIEEEYEDLDIEFVDERGEIPGFKDTFINKVGSITINEKYEHQKLAIQAFDNHVAFRDQTIYFPRGIADAATNSGKTTMMAGLYLNLEGDNNMLLTIHRVSIFNQLVDNLEEVFGRSKVGQINAKKYKIAPVTVAMINTLYSRIDTLKVQQDLARFNILAVDESHRAGSKTYTKVLLKCPAAVRVFFSGSALDADRDEIVGKMTMIGMSGPKKVNISKREMMDKGISTEAKVYMHLCNTILRRPPIGYDAWEKECIHYSIERVSLIWKLVRENYKDGLVIIAVNEIHHGEFLLERLMNFNFATEDGIVIMITHSQDKGQAEKIRACQSGDIDVLITTTVLKEGINLPLLKTVIYTPGGKSKIDVKQWMGRLERLLEGKTEAAFHDFMDVGQYVQSHSMARRKIYVDEELDLKEYYDIKSIKNMSSVVIN